MAKIAIDAGHYINTPGKRCMKFIDPNETREWVMNDRVADALEKYLVSAGHECLRVDDPTGKNEVELGTRCNKANNWKADYYCSIHHNAGVNGGAGGGTVVYIYPGESGITVDAQKAIYKYCIARGGLKGNRSQGMASAYFYVLGETNMPASLIECGFMDSTTDVKYIIDPEWSKKFALGIAEGICEVYGGVIQDDVLTTKPATKPIKPESVTEDTKKPVEEVAKEVLNGKWGNGTDRKDRLIKAGYNYDIVQAKVNELNNVKMPVVTSKPDPVKKTVEYAKSKSNGIAGTYKVIAPSGLNIRYGAGTNKDILVTVPKGTAMKCYGYYTKVGNTLWYYVQLTHKDTTYKGFCSCEWLARA